MIEIVSTASLEETWHLPCELVSRCSWDISSLLDSYSIQGNARSAPRGFLSDTGLVDFIHEVLQYHAFGYFFFPVPESPWGQELSFLLRAKFLAFNHGRSVLLQPLAFQRHLSESTGRGTHGWIHDQNCHHKLSDHSGTRSHQISIGGGRSARPCFYMFC